MTDVSTLVYNKLSDMGIEYIACAHPPVHTIEDCAYAEAMLNGVVPKNIFLTPRNMSAFYLLIVRPNAVFKTSDISKQLGCSRLSFAPADKLMEYMRTLPGAISPMGLMFDERHEVKLCLDSKLSEIDTLIFHPCVNTASLAMKSSDFFDKYLPALNYQPTYVEIHDFVTRSE